jgi:(p)ppGpp synthase/HD superfamily hydrolase
LLSNASRRPHTASPQALAAIAYAQWLHAGQRRQADGAPFILHPLEVACPLYQAGACDDVIAAGVLHDTIEKTDATAADLRTRFGPTIATLVLAVSDDERIIGYSQRKAALRETVASAGREALMVLAADKISRLENCASRASRLVNRVCNKPRSALSAIASLLTTAALIFAING